MVIFKRPLQIPVGLLQLQGYFFGPGYQSVGYNLKTVKAHVLKSCYKQNRQTTVTRLPGLLSET